ncbi:ABC transporter G family member 29 [Forsythia ovata]|uniref:ABC transporter G family member 29 n=1 Tax=Forsythia ovata TaxID=205694 RepID=A0ABD1RIT5_9LAMI
MDLVKLDSLKNAIVEISGVTGLSTEQRKILTIAVELVANPSIIFIDEPTSGLDERAATSVMRTVRNPVDTRKTVVCIIHQPSIDIFESFDEAITGAPKIKEKYNPAAWMLEVSSVASQARLGMDFSEYYKSTNLSE